jgi:hypothetical protein
MVRMRPLLCILGRHRWQTRSDTEGSVTSCRRCGKLRHTGTDFVSPGDPDQHAAEGYIASTTNQGLP